MLGREQAQAYRYVTRMQDLSVAVGYIRLGNSCADALHKCDEEAARTGKGGRCTLDVQPPRRVDGQWEGR